ncbi:hypothetical protein C2W62_48910 [Candidatus Entotheonella serta]|nr:hypothetical protein C2W62_48910 [Candidatus Entotheonella serta]
MWLSRLSTDWGEDQRGIRIVEHEATIIRTIFKRHDQNIPVTVITEELNTQGYRLRNGNPWTPRQVRRILNKRPLYAEGKVTYGETKGRNKALILLPK